MLHRTVQDLKYLMWSEPYWLMWLDVAIGHTPGWIPVRLSTCMCVVDSSTGFWDRTNVWVLYSECPSKRLIDSSYSDTLILSRSILVKDPGIPGRGRGCQLIICPIPSKNSMKMKNFWPKLITSVSHRLKIRRQPAINIPMNTSSIAVTYTTYTNQGPCPFSFFPGDQLLADQSFLAVPSWWPPFHLLLSTHKKEWGSYLPVPLKSDWKHYLPSRLSTWSVINSQSVSNYQIRKRHTAHRVSRTPSAVLSRGGGAGG